MKSTFIKSKPTYNSLLILWALRFPKLMSEKLHYNPTKFRFLKIIDNVCLKIIKRV